MKGGTPRLLGETPATDLVGYTPDGAFITYVARRDGRSNVFGRPCGGGPERQMTHFSDNAGLYAAAWSRDGRLAVSRWTERSDVVLIRVQVARGGRG